MIKKVITGLREVYKHYDAFFIDLWGVMHNGIDLYPEAIEVVENLYKLKKRFVLMSNAPRPSKNVEKFLLNLKMDKILIQNVFTSGEAALKSLQKNTYGKNFYHLGPDRDSSLYEGFEKYKKDLKEADFILCTGFLDKHSDTLDFYKDLLKKHLNLKMICTNPDLIVHRGSKEEYCAGTLAAIFKEMVCKVVYFGKPYGEIYKFCIKNDDEKVLVVGDNIRTDIKGANNMSYDSLIITSGVHNKEFEKEDIKKVLKNYNVKATFSQSILKW